VTWIQRCEEPAHGAAPCPARGTHAGRRANRLASDRLVPWVQDRVKAFRNGRDAPHGALGRPCDTAMVGGGHRSHRTNRFSVEQEILTTSLQTHVECMLKDRSGRGHDIADLLNEGPDIFLWGASQHPWRHMAAFGARPSCAIFLQRSPGLPPPSNRTPTLWHWNARPVLQSRMRRST
jgi:hypothetical protein